MSDSVSLGFICLVTLSSLLLNSCGPVVLFVDENSSFLFSSGALSFFLMWRAKRREQTGFLKLLTACRMCSFLFFMSCRGRPKLISLKSCSAIRPRDGRRLWRIESGESLVMKTSRHKDSIVHLLRLRAREPVIQPQNPYAQILPCHDGRFRHKEPNGKDFSTAQPIAASRAEILPGLGLVSNRLNRDKTSLSRPFGPHGLVLLE